MRLFSEDNGKSCAIFFDNNKEGTLLIAIIEAAVTGKPLHKQSNAYKLAKKIENELACFDG